MANIEAILNVAAVNRSGALCRGAVLSELPVIVADSSKRESVFVLELEVECRTEILLLKSLHIMDLGIMTLFGAQFRGMVMNNGSNAGLQLSLLVINFYCMQGGDMTLFNPFRFLQAPVEFAVCVTPFWSADLRLQAEFRGVCGLESLPISACLREVSNADVILKRLETAVDITAVVTYIKDLPLNAAMNMPAVKVNAMARFSASAVVVLTPKGGVVYADTLLEPCWNLCICVDARKLGDAVCATRIKPRIMYVCDAELRVEVD